MKEIRSQLSQPSKRLAFGPLLFAVCCSGALLFALCHSVQAQQPGKIYRLGFLSGGFPGPSPDIEAFRQGLRDLGYIEGKNLLIDYRYAERKSDRYPELAADLVRLKVDVIVANGTEPTTVAKQATSTIPIVMTSAKIRNARDLYPVLLSQEETSPD